MKCESKKFINSQKECIKMKTKLKQMTEICKRKLN